MKKIILSAVVLLLNFNFAIAQDQKKLPTKVVITQSSSSGLSNAYAHLEKFADKKNILMTPIYKPGANGLIGINYASRQNDVLVLSTITDYLNAPSGKNFKPVGVINEVELVLIASKKSNIKNIDDLVTVEKNYPGKLNWAQTSTAQEVIINQLASIRGLDTEKIHRINYKDFKITDIISGDIDLMFLMHSVAKSLSDTGTVTIVDIDQPTLTKMSLKQNAVILFASESAEQKTIEFWHNFLNEFLKDNDVRESYKKRNSKLFDNSSPELLEKMLINWTNK